MTRVLTTGQVAQIFSVNINTVIKWFDEGKLGGFRLPRSNERRIYRESVVDFMTAHGITPELLKVFEDTRGTRKRGRKPAGEPAHVGLDGATVEELRTFPRKPVDLPGTLTGEDAVVLGPIAVRNLSMGGAFLVGFVPPQRCIPEDFRLSFQLGEGPARLDVDVQLVHARRGDTGFTLGVRFTRVDPGALQRYLATI